MRIPAPSSSLLLALLLACGHATAATPLACEGRITGANAGELTCPLGGPGTSAQQLLFVAQFSGVHDDSQAAFKAVVDGAPVACADGDTTRIDGDEGGDTLSCHFAVQGGARHLVVNVLWHHAQPMSVQVLRD
jgi:hypothetical protein